MKTAIRVLLTALFALVATEAVAQCTGVFAVGQVCGNPSTSAAAPPRGTASPILGTQVTVPKVIGGSGAASTLTLQSTSGVGAGSDAVVITGGNNGASQLGSFNLTGSTVGLAVGVAGATKGTIGLTGSTSGVVTITPQATAGTATFTLPNTSGTPVISLPSPMTNSATTGAGSWTGLTSGGVLYNSSTTAVGSSALLAQNALVIGGGAGAAPATSTVFSLTGSGTILSGSSSTTAVPQVNLINTTSDSSAASLVFDKSRSGGNTLTNDGLFDLLGRGFANSAAQNGGRIQILQAASSSGSNIPTKFVVSTGNTAGALNHTITFDNAGHISVTQATAPTVTAGCNGAGSSVTGNDTYGTVTGQTAAATTCTITFGTAFAATPHCVASGLSSPLTGAITPSTTTLVVNFGSTANYKFTYHCFGA
jgi:hypothetical protein